MWGILEIHKKDERDTNLEIFKQEIKNNLNGFVSDTYLLTTDKSKSQKEIK